MLKVSDIRSRRLDKTQARKLLTKITHQHPANVRFSRHALNELENDDLTLSDILNVIRSPDAKIVGDGEYENGSFRYRLETNRITVVVAFDSPTSFVVVTTWGKKT